MKAYIKKTGKMKLLIAFSAAMALMANPAKAQLNPFGAMYFQNQYLGNPAMAGSEQGLNTNLGYRQQWSNVPGAPQTQSLTADYGTGKKVGLGISLNSDKAGLMKRTRAMGTYAYHLPFNGDQEQLSFGLSLGFMSERIDNSAISGNQSDVSVMQYNIRETYIDGDFGIAYSSSRLMLQAAVPGLKSFIKQEQRTLGADRPIFMAAASYKLHFKQGLDGMGIEPKAVYRKVKGYDDLFDAGANVTFANSSANILAMYHSSKSTTLGLGVDYRKRLQIMGLYTTETSALRTYANGAFEISLRIRTF